MKPLKIVFAGTPEFAVPSLKAIADSNHHLLGIYTQPDRPSGRGQKLQSSAVKLFALEREIPVYQPLHFKSEETVEELGNLAPDLIVVIAYGLILPEAVLNLPRLGCINVHASILPRWRGASPIQQAILHGDKETGVTIMQMDKGMDTGDILLIQPCLISSQDTAGSLHNKLAQLAVNPLLQILEGLAKGEVNPRVQDNNLVEYAGKIKKEDAAIHWQNTAEHINRQIRAYNPWPIAYTQIDDLTLRIHQAATVDCKHKAQPGTILSLSKKGLLVAAKEDQAILVEVLQFPGKKAMSVADWLNAGSKQLKEGLIFQ